MLLGRKIVRKYRSIDIDRVRVIGNCNYRYISILILLEIERTSKDRQKDYRKRQNRKVAEPPGHHQVAHAPGRGPGAGKPGAEHQAKPPGGARAPPGGRPQGRTGNAGMAEKAEADRRLPAPEPRKRGKRRGAAPPSASRSFAGLRPRRARHARRKGGCAWLRAPSLTPPLPAFARGHARSTLRAD